MRYKIEDRYSLCGEPEIFPSTAEERKIYFEEKDVTIGNLARLTAEGKMHWVCTAHLPIDSIPGDDDEVDLYLVQSFDVEGSYNGRDYKLELMESITLLAGGGDMSIDFHTDRESTPIDSISLSMRYGHYSSMSQARNRKRYQADNIAKLFDLIISSIAGSDTVQKACADRNMIGLRYSERTLNHKLFRLCYRLREDGRALDFHKCVLDADYREQLCREYGIG